LKVWRGIYEEFDQFNDNDMNLSNLRKAADVLKVQTGILLPPEDSKPLSADEES
jgi:hypothetical protein